MSVTWGVLDIDDMYCGGEGSSGCVALLRCLFCQMASSREKKKKSPNSVLKYRNCKIYSVVGIWQLQMLYYLFNMETFSCFDYDYGCFRTCNGSTGRYTGGLACCIGSDYRTCGCRFISLVQTKRQVRYGNRVHTRSARVSASIVNLGVH